MQRIFIYTLLTFATLMLNNFSHAAEEEEFVAAQPVDDEPVAAAPKMAKPVGLSSKPAPAIKETTQAKIADAAKPSPASASAAPAPAPISKPEAAHKPAPMEAEAPSDAITENPAAHMPAMQEKPVMHNPARDSQTDFRYCLDLKTNEEIAACRYK